MNYPAMLATTAFGGAAFVSLVAVADSRTAEQSAAAAPTNATTQARIEGGAPFIDRFDTLNSRIWAVSDGWRNGDWAVNDWRRSQVRADGKLHLTLDRNQTDLAEFSGAELQGRQKYGHGYYEVKMRAAPASGTVSGFFTYTGPHFGDPWDEIDIEILGAKPREVMLTYFRDSKKVSYIHQLGFDATAQEHVYGFDWQPGYIRWYVDGQMVHEATGEGLPLPITKQKLMVSLWGSQKLASWVGPFDPAEMPTVMTVDCIAFSVDFASRQGCN
ncbi:glycoside hydrolase [Aurantiacibacter xanthus]|uniref:Glycoside hydrolase n=1 Tax=Aurantiacibacter xanthus TaxID=1784712 RepID=A0A3A1P9U4_9SPHN|nr:family 16 glycosylhydrolase [Aurantiacibacter xanthus]RIV89761.1 glycoside hydrolase [Aurantiacibacter xanthus]